MRDSCNTVSNKASARELHRGHPRRCFQCDEPAQQKNLLEGEGETERHTAHRNSSMVTSSEVVFHLICGTLGTVMCQHRTDIRFTALGD